MGSVHHLPFDAPPLPRERCQDPNCAEALRSDRLALDLVRADERIADLEEVLRVNGLAGEIPRRPGLLVRLWGRWRGVFEVRR
jgi:hypothetical protein